MTPQADQPVTLVPAQPATLLAGGRQISVDDWPLTRAVNELRSVELAVSADHLVIEPRRRAGPGGILVATILMLLGAASLGIPLILLASLSIYLSALLITVAFAFLAMFIRRNLSRMRWITFDRRAKQLVFERRVGFRNQRVVESAYPLDTILAVQMLHSGHQSLSELHGTGDRQWSSYREFDSYELNLVLGGKSPPRLNLASLADWQWIRETGGRIAEFLGVPVIDKLYHGN